MALIFNTTCLTFSETKLKTEMKRRKKKKIYKWKRKQWIESEGVRWIIKNGAVVQLWVYFFAWAFCGPQLAQSTDQGRDALSVLIQSSQLSFVVLWSLSLCKPLSDCNYCSLSVTFFPFYAAKCFIIILPRKQQRQFSYHIHSNHSKPTLLIPLVNLIYGFC